MKRGATSIKVEYAQRPEFYAAITLKWKSNSFDWEVVAVHRAVPALRRKPEARTGAHLGADAQSMWASSKPGTCGSIEGGIAFPSYSPPQGLVAGVLDRAQRVSGGSHGEGSAT